MVAALLTSFLSISMLLPIAIGIHRKETLRMRNPASLDLVRSIKSFIVSFSFYAANPENDGKRIQDFFLTMEAAIRDHPLWTGASDAEIDNALEGLEKYVMTKLHSRTFASSAEDVKMDGEISDKICLLQTFLRPQHLDIPPVLQNEASWLLAEKELKKINAFKAPREKLLCIMNCCRVINNLLLNASISEDHVLGGADDFLPVLIYVTIKANPPQLHSNLKFIQLYRRQDKLISEAAYFLTNLVSAKSFIVDLNAKSLSIEEIEFEESMQAARLIDRVPQVTLPTLDKRSTFGNLTDPGPSTLMHGRETNLNSGSNYPYMEAEAGELTVGDVERLLSLYKDLVTKYNSLCNAVRHLSISKTVSPAQQGTNDLLKECNGTNSDTSCQED
ncbi:vacuolar protein sorting-associated protein 9A-like [Durio zibethinus]|uniref:Vacuolar protein sorting-associated protein 9A-like n=1 Tax=Durio zibethinus TaxID=66656 RepID=A0A6P5WR63_DURZI|nr:vacuolar protein sorting-associated protein 9A-like [Durio zibethinus]